MQLTMSSSGPGGIRPPVAGLLERMVGQFVGLDRSVSFLLRDRTWPRLCVAGGELTGVHVLQGIDEPPPRFYHIGGGGVAIEEALIKTLGETAERYAQFASERLYGDELVFTSYDDLVQTGERVLAPDKLQFFQPAQHASSGFPFQPFARDRPLSWIRLDAAWGPKTWVPAQLVLVGYTLRRPEESWLLPAVTTGTAAHTTPLRALRAALLELVQVDAAMGHWYSSARAPRIVGDRRTSPVDALVARLLAGSGVRARFHWLPSPDLAGTTVACVLSDPGRRPAAAVGLGCDLSLNRAIYGALLEATGVLQLARVTQLDRIGDAGHHGGPAIDPTSIGDLDSNVLYYAMPEVAGRLDDKFPTSTEVRAADLPADTSTDPRDDVRLLVDSFRRAGKELLYADLTTPDVADLGLSVARAWSPDTISLCLPSFPPLGHPRLADYGGGHHSAPHPYP